MGKIGQLRAFRFNLSESPLPLLSTSLEASWNVMAHAQKPDFFSRGKGRVYLNRRGRQFSRILAAEVYASAVVMLDTPCCEVVWRVLATHSIRQFPLHFPSRASPCAITFELESTCENGWPPEPVWTLQRRDKSLVLSAKWATIHESSIP